ncbi:hypothetical protein, partial [Nioella sp. MMSF_3534]|uniref:hypothetical protein n=1 Tax=Nioella sp. MMSF_3534 TaxID=3046720 RepID=UPI00273E08D9
MQTRLLLPGFVFNDGNPAQPAACRSASLRPGAWQDRPWTPPHSREGQSRLSPTPVAGHPPV